MKIKVEEPREESYGKIKVDPYIYGELKHILELKPWNARPALEKFFNGLTPQAQRTGQQNRALHKFYELLAEALNMAGLEMKVILKGEAWWTPQSVKEYLWRPLQKKMFQKQSTTELEKQVEIDKIHENLMRLLGEKYGVEYIPFPSNPDKKEELEEDKIDYPEWEGGTAFD